MQMQLTSREIERITKMCRRTDNFQTRLVQPPCMPSVHAGGFFITNRRRRIDAIEQSAIRELLRTLIAPPSHGIAAASLLDVRHADRYSPARPPSIRARTRRACPDLEGRKRDRPREHPRRPPLLQPVAWRQGREPCPLHRDRRARIIRTVAFACRVRAVRALGDEGGEAIAD